jgi:ADP-ribose pyrophosphatase YjhB (NUDIX family)
MKEYNYCPVCAASLQEGIVDGRKRKYCPKCNFIHYENPLPVASAIPVKDKKFLLIKRGLPPQKGTWRSPAGFIESGETPEEACLRELKEETGMSGEIVKLIGVDRVDDREVYGDMLVIRYLVKVSGGELVPEKGEIEDARFFDVSELPDYYVALFKDVIEQVQNGEVC